MKYFQTVDGENHSWLGTKTNKLSEADLVVFPGGADINPGMYGEITGMYTNFDSDRDKYEMGIYHSTGKPKLGICRGAQFLCVMNGGKLVQHVTNHTKHHDIETFLGNYKITSTHHQMMYPWDTNFIMMGYSLSLSDKYLNGKDEEIFLHKKFQDIKNPVSPKNYIAEPEIVFFPDTNTLCIQGHPEHTNCPSETTTFIRILVGLLIEGKLEKFYYDSYKN